MKEFKCYLSVSDYYISNTHHIHLYCDCIGHPIYGDYGIRTSRITRITFDKQKMEAEIETRNSIYKVKDKDYINFCILFMQNKDVFEDCEVVWFIKE